MFSRRSFLASVPAIAAPTLLPAYEGHREVVLEVEAELHRFPGSSPDLFKITLFADPKKDVFGGRKHWNSFTTSWEMSFKRVKDLYDLSHSFAHVTARMPITMRNRSFFFMRGMSDLVGESTAEVAIEMTRKNFDVIWISDRPVTVVRVPFMAVDKIIKELLTTKSCTANLRGNGQDVRHLFEAAV